MSTRWGMGSAAVAMVLWATSVGWGQPVDYDWVVTWQGQDRPGPVDLPFTTGWPADEAGFEQHNPNGCYDEPPGPDYAEAANVVLDGWLAIQNLMDGSCIGIGHPDGGPCNTMFNFLEIREDPCGMRYQVGPRTVRNFDAPYSSELMAYHGTDFAYEFGTGFTAEMSFYIAESPQFTWTNLIEIEGYPKYNNPWNGAGGSYSDNNYMVLQLRHFLSGFPDNEWHLVASADNTFSLGKVADLMNRWITVRVALGVAPKPQMVVWVDGIQHHSSGWDAVNSGDANGENPHGYCRFGYPATDGDVRIGHMAFTNQGAFSPNPRGQCRNVGEGWRYFRHLPQVSRTRANPEICDNAIDDDGDGDVDCEDSECFQNDVCDNLLVNGSFERPISPCEEVSCPTIHNTQPAGWSSLGSGMAATHGDQWVPEPPGTDGPTRGSVSSSGGSSTVYQTVSVVPDTVVTLKGDIATGHMPGTVFDHFVELVDGDETSSTVIDAFVTTASDTAFQPVSLSGVCTSGQCTVRWGYRTTTGSGPVSTHVDNLYLIGTPVGRCNDPFADADGDGDVDQYDFATWQLCHTGPGGGPPPIGCECFDVQGPSGTPDGDVDAGDFNLFIDCASGPMVLADASCDDGVELSPIQILQAVSRKTHGSAGDFDVDLLGPDPVEGRNDGPDSVVIVFDDFVQAADGSFDVGEEISATGGTIVSAELNCDTINLELNPIDDPGCLTITLSGIALLSDPAAVMPTRQLQVVALLGDADGSGTVTQADQDAVSAATGQAVTNATFRYDVVPDGVIDNIDVIITGSASGDSASCP